MYEKILKATDYIKSIVGGFTPEIGIVLGSGLGDLANDIHVEYTIPYADIPHFPVSTVAGHKGCLLFGTLNGKRLIAMQGRFHYYEGYSAQEITLPIRVMKQLGIRFLILSNASGGMNPNFRIADIMIITDHINLIPSPLIGPNDDRLGIRFPDMGEAYNKKLIALADDIAEKHNIKVQHGVYVGNIGPAYETPAEYEFFRVIGGDAVGMSTTPETLVARHCGLPVFAVSVISDLGGKEMTCVVSHEEVINAVAKATPPLSLLIKELICRSNEVQFDNE